MMLNTRSKQYTQQARGAAAGYMAALALRSSCGDECRVIGPAGYFARNRYFAGRGPQEIPGAFWCWGLARPMGRARYSGSCVGAVERCNSDDEDQRRLRQDKRTIKQLDSEKLVASAGNVLPLFERTALCYYCDLTRGRRPRQQTEH
jgi:hypothetical protein